MNRIKKYIIINKQDNVKLSLVTTPNSATTHNFRCWSQHPTWIQPTTRNMAIISNLVITTNDAYIIIRLSTGHNPSTS